MRITIYQIIPELDQERLMFLPLSCFQKAGYQTPPAGIYESVFCGETEAATLEEMPRLSFGVRAVLRAAVRRSRGERAERVLARRRHGGQPVSDTNR